MTLSADDQARLARAFELACRWHGTQTRKGSDVPYVSHLFQVAGMVLEHGGSADQAAAALLHDAVEDTEASLDEIAAQVGERVAAIVDHCTDTLPGDTPSAKSPWTQRKARYVERLRAAPDDAVLVAACDKVHNLASLVADARRDGLAAAVQRDADRPARVLRRGCRRCGGSGSRGGGRHAQPAGGRPAGDRHSPVGLIPRCRRLITWSRYRSRSGLRVETICSISA